MSMSEHETAFPELTDDELETTARQIEKASSEYDIMGVLDERVGLGERHRLLWHLTRTRTLEIESFPELWSELDSGYEHASPDDVFDVLSRIESDGKYGPLGGSELEHLLGDWPVALDRLACKAYNDAPEIASGRWDEFSEPIQTGLQFVQRRFGDIELDALPDDILRDLAYHHVRNRGIPTHLHVVQDGELREERIQDFNGPYNSSLYDFVGAYGSRREWENTLLEVALEVDNQLALAESRDGWKRASQDELVELMASMKTGRRVLDELYYVLLYDRDDAPGDLFEVAHRLREDESLGWAWTSEIALASGVLKLKERGDPVPEWTDDLWTLETIEGSMDRNGYIGLEQLTKALEYVQEERIVNRVLELFAKPEGVSHTRPYPVLHLWPDRDDPLDKSFEYAQQKAEESYASVTGSMSEIVHGWIFVGIDILPRLIRKLRLTANSVLHDTCLWAIVGILADRVEDGQMTPTGYQEHVTFVDWESDGARGRDFERHIKPDVAQAFEGISTERAESLLLDELDPSRDRWPQALAGVPVHPTQSLIDRAFALVEAQGVHEAQGDCNWFSTMLEKLGEKESPKITSALAQSDDPDVHSTVQDVFGESRYQEMLEKFGDSSMADASQFDTIERLANMWLDDHPDAPTTTIHMLERTDTLAELEAVSRVGGTPRGIDRASWPHQNGDPDLPMTHMFTLDRRDVPSLDAQLEEGERAVSLFVQQPDRNNAYQPHNDEVGVVVLTEEELEEKQIEGELPAGSPGGGKAIRTRSIEVPAVVFERYTDEWFNADPGPLKKVRELIFKSDAHSGGGPLWLQPKQPVDSPFLMQFDTSFCPMDLGDAGIMYVFRETAFWQCC